MLPPEIVARLGFEAGVPILVDEESNSLRLRRSVEQLAKVYVDVGTGPHSLLSESVFIRVLEGLVAFEPVPAVLFGGLFEPLTHPGIVEMVERVKTSGSPRIELLTDGRSLTEEMSRRLIEAGLDVLWVALGDEFASGTSAQTPRAPVLENIEWFKSVRRRIQVDRLPAKERTRFYAGLRIRDSWRLPDPVPALGIVFTATQTSISSLPWLINETHRMGARHFVVTNAPPGPAGMAMQTLYQDRLTVSPFPTLWSDRLRLPLMDIDDETRESLTATIGSYQRGLARSDTSNVTGRCPFVEAGATVIGWQGDVFPCLALAERRDTATGGVAGSVAPYPVGSLTGEPTGEASLPAIWSDGAYVDLRRSVQQDCDQDALPMCRGCLWSRGLIVCP